jgi:hypothetical protein
MKHLKRFDEELNPSTYRTAGQRLIRKFKEERGRKLIYYGNEQEFGFYNMCVGNINTKLGNNGGDPQKFTNPKATFYFNSIGENFYGNGTAPLVKNKTAEELVKSWKEGDNELVFTISFRFQAAEESKINIKHDIMKESRGTPMFSFRVELSDWYNGLDEWNTDQDTGDMIVGDEAHDIYDMFVNTFHYPHITLERPDDKYYFGIFSDRASANRFVKNDLPRLLEPFEGHIHDIISAIGGDPEHIDKIKELFPSPESLFGSISVNGLYDDDRKASASNSNFSNRWFSDNVISTKK